MNIPEQAVEAAAWAAHRQFWLDSYGDETGTAEKVAKDSWTPKAQERRRSEMRAALTAALPLVGVMREDILEIVSDVCVLESPPADDPYERALHEAGLEITRRIRAPASPRAEDQS